MLSVKKEKPKDEEDEVGTLGNGDPIREKPPGGD